MNRKKYLHRQVWLSLFIYLTLSVASCGDTSVEPRLVTVRASLEVNDSENTLSVAEEFTLHVSVENVTDLFAAAFEIVFNGEIISPKFSSQGDLLGEFQIYYDNRDSSSVSVGCSRKAGEGGVTGNGILATITFEAIAAGTTNVGLKEYKLTLMREDGTTINVQSVKECAVTVE